MGHGALDQREELNPYHPHLLYVLTSSLKGGLYVIIYGIYVEGIYGH